ncbi:MAG: fumarylacetoacetase [Gemmatimonadetes bacterium]|nr:fumarylacetoacetase [Gemmatimonadota bacterium]
MTDLDRSHDPALTSWVTSANGHSDFPIQNLPFGLIDGQGEDPEIVVAIGDQVLHLRTAVEAGWGSELSIDAITRIIFGPLNHFAAAGPNEWTAVRLALSDALSDPSWQERLSPALLPQDAVEMLLPVHIGDYTDFYASVYHATNVGSMFRPDNPLLPNYKWVPIGYHGRASSIVLDGTPIRRPQGQTKAADADTPTFGPSRSLDYELEVALVIGGENDLGTPVTSATATDRIFGVVLLNDWSARDLQAWEYQPLGPFLAKNFASTISPWVVTTDALRPFRAAMPARAAGDPAPLPYLQVPGDRTWHIGLEVALQTAAMRSRGDAPFVVSRVDFADAMYWSPAQLVTHHGSNGCNLTPGDLLGSGTISGPAAESRGCLLERTWRGAEPLTLPDGTSRKFLEDGDEVLMTGRCESPGAVPIGFGACRGVVAPA